LSSAILISLNINIALGKECCSALNTFIEDENSVNTMIILFHYKILPISVGDRIVIIGNEDFDFAQI